MNYRLNFQQRKRPGKPLNNNLSTILKFEYDINIEDYRRFHNEISQHTTNQQQIINLAILFIGALIALWQFFISDYSKTLENHLVAIDSHLTIQVTLLVSSIVFSIFTVIQFWHDLMIAHMCEYINEVIKKNVKSILISSKKNQLHEPSLSFWEYETWIVNKQKGKILEYIMGVSRYAITFLPSASILVYYTIERPFSFQLDIWEISLFFITLMIFLINFLCALYIGRYYLFNFR